MNENEKEIRQAVQARVQSEEETRLVTGGEGPEDPITSSFIYDCLMGNEYGDGLLFTALHRNRFVLNKTNNQWFYWGGHHWKADILEGMYKGVEAVAQKYLAEAEKIGKQITDALANDQPDKAKQLRSLQSEYLGRVKRLRSLRGAQNC